MHRRLVKILAQTRIWTDKGIEKTEKEADDEDELKRDMRDIVTLISIRRIVCCIRVSETTRMAMT